VIRTDLTSGLRGPFDLILFNPPYLPTSAEEQIDDWLEYALDGGITGREVIERFLSEVPLLLSPEGRVLLLISSLNGFEETKKLIQSTGWDCMVTDREVVEGGEILLVCRLVRSLSGDMK
jgi:release factor glutamine methyltransferase